MAQFRQSGQSQLLLADDHLVIDSPYDPAQVADTKKIPGARWDRVARVWRIPMTSLAQARDFAARWDLWIDPEILTFTLPSPRGGAAVERPTDDGVVRLVDDELEIIFPFDSLKVESVKRLPHTRFVPKSQSFRAPASLVREVCEWAQRFRCTPDDEVLALRAAVIAAEQEQVAASRAEDADVVVARLNGELRPFQRAGVAYALRSRRCFIADDMGLGKTMMSLAALEAADEADAGSGFPAVVVCPATLTHNWRAEAARWLPHRRVAIVENRSEWPEGEHDLLVVGWSNIAYWTESLAGYRSYIFDESHYAKSPTAKRTKAAIKVAKGAPGLVLCLTGTPVTNRPAEYASQLEILGRLRDFGGRWDFYKRYCNAFKDRFGQWHFEGASHLEELNDRLRSSCYIRRTKDQVMSDLPPVLHQPLVVMGAPKAMKEYERAQADIVAYMMARAEEIAAEVGDAPGSARVRARFRAEANEHLVRMSQLRRLAALAKHAALDEWVEIRLTEGRKFVLAAHHREIVDDLALRFGGLKIQGGQATEEIEEHKRRFQELPAEEAPCIVLSIQAAKTGHTLTAAEDICFVELPWTPADLDQTTARLHRIGQKGSVTATYLLAENTIDERIYDLINAKRAIVDVAIDGQHAAGKATFDAGDLVTQFLAFT